MKNKDNWLTLLIFVGILFLAIFSFGFGNDYYWHVKAGEYIVHNLKIPYYDIFSWYGISHHLYWFSHEWLSEVVLYLYKVIFKDYGPIMFNASMYLVLIMILFVFLKKNLSKNKIFTFSWAIFGMLVFSTVMLPRPHIISYILLAITMYLLFDNFNHKESKKIYLLPVISFLWANFHGGSSNLVYLLCFIFMVVGLFTFNFGKITATKIDKQQIIRYSIVGIISFLVLAINPHGIKIWSYPYVNIMDNVLISNIVEWASPSLNKSEDIICFLLLGLIIITMIITKYKIKLIDFITMGIFLILGFKSVRFIPLVYIASSFVIFNWIDKDSLVINKIIVITFIIFLLGSSAFLSTKLVDNYKIKKIPDEIIEYIKKRNPKRLYNYYDYGGYLIYNDIQVFVDGRTDLYSSNILKDALDIQNHGYKYLLEGYDFDMIVIPCNIPLNIVLSTNNNYYSSMQHDNTIIYEKKSL